MQTRLRNALGLAAAATLLSGSAFAVCPDFDADLPTVVITNTTAGGGADPGPAFTFRYSAAFNVVDYINDGVQTTNLADLRFLFNEFDDFSDTSANGAAERTLRINGTEGLDAVPAGGDWATAPFVTARGAAGPLDFRNFDFSGEEGDAGPFDNIGDVTGDDITAGDQSRVVTLYLRSDDAACTTASAASFLVVTSTDAGGDTLSDPFISDPFTCGSVTTTFDGWNSSAIALLFTIPSNGVYSSGLILGDGTANAITFTPATTPSVAAASLGITLGEIGIGSWTFPDSAASPVALAADTLYRFRYNLQSSTSTSSTTRANQLRLRVGIGDQAGASLGWYVNRDLPNPDTSVQFGAAGDFYQYLHSEGAGNVEVALEAITFESTRTDQLTLNEMEICSADPADMGGSTVLKNEGGTFTALAADAGDDPGAAANAFSIGTATLGQDWSEDGSSATNAARPVTVSATGTALTGTWPVQAGAATGDIFASYANFKVAQDLVTTSAAGYFTASEANLYRMDLWVSSPNPAAPVFPSIAFIAATGNIHYSAAQWVVNPNRLFTATPNGAAITSNARQYSLWFSPQLQGGGTATGKVDPQILLLETQSQVQGSPATLTIHRVVVREYDNPLF